MEKSYHTPIGNRHSQRGVILALTLVILVIITLLATTGMRSTTLEERMSGNNRNSSLAFQQAEATLRQAENVLENSSSARILTNGMNNNVTMNDGTPVSCVVTGAGKVFTTTADWVSAPLPCAFDVSATDTVTRTSNYFIEYLRDERTMIGGGAESIECFYRITAQGYGADNNSKATVQSIFHFPACSDF